MNATRTERTYPMSAKYLARFEEKYVISDDGCWEWRGHVNHKGYGYFHYGRLVGAHRVAYQHFVGPISTGLELDHLCRVRCCVNPEHLEQVTHRENLLRSRSQVAINAAKTECWQGHIFDTANTYTSPQGKRGCRACIRERKLRYRAAAYRREETE